VRGTEGCPQRSVSARARRSGRWAFPSSVVAQKSVDDALQPRISFQGNWIDQEVEKRPTTLPNRISPRIRQQSKGHKVRRWAVATASTSSGSQEIRQDRTDLLMLGYRLGKCSLTERQLRKFELTKLLVRRDSVIREMKNQLPPRLSIYESGTRR
jgi:hypothetical protein